jgi:hypothetical protein
MPVRYLPGVLSSKPFGDGNISCYGDTSLKRTGRSTSAMPILERGAGGRNDVGERHYGEGRVERLAIPWGRSTEESTKLTVLARRSPGRAAQL